jgi:hypothetical protein
MLSQSKIFDQLERTFEQGAEYAFAIQLFDFFKNYPKTTHITLQLARQIALKNEFKFEDVEIVRALTFLAGDSVQVLATGFELIEDDESVHTLTADELGVILSDSINPITGDVDPDIKEKVALFFSLTEEAQTFFETLNSKKGFNV